jgi:hypothetical protein
MKIELPETRGEVDRGQEENKPMAFEQELAAFKRELPRLLAEQASQINPPRYALVQGDTVHGVWDTEADAVRAGYRLFGLNRFMVKKVEEVEQPIQCLHDLVRPCQQ